MSSSLGHLARVVNPSIFKGLMDNDAASRRVEQLTSSVWPKREPTKLPELNLPPDPVHKTNKLLSDVALHIEGMRELSKATAEMQRSLNDTAARAVADFSAGAAEAQAASKDGLKIARRGLWVALISLVVSVIALGASIYLGMRQGTADEAKEKAAQAQLAKLIEAERNLAASVGNLQGAIDNAQVDDALSDQGQANVSAEIQ